MSKTKVLFIAGWGRSGTTLLGNILGQLEGYASLGELRHVWDRGVLENRKCGCGKDFHDCELWTGIFNDAFGGMDKALAGQMVHNRDSLLRTRHMPFIQMKSVRNKLMDRARGTIDNLAKLYTSIHKQTGCRVIVDSSKSPADAYLLAQVPEIDLYTVHVVRDPRAVAYSWWSRQKKMGDGKGDEMERYSPMWSSLLWNAWNVYIPRIWRANNWPYMYIQYESFIQKPQQDVEAIAKFIDEQRATLPFVNDREVRITPCHMVSGNPNRFSTGNLKLKTDNEWETKMSPLLRTAVSALTVPVRGRFGY